MNYFFNVPIHLKYDFTSCVHLIDILRLKYIY